MTTHKKRTSGRPRAAHRNSEALDMRWSVSRQKTNLAEKQSMARYFVDHHFLLDVQRSANRFTESVRSKQKSGPQSSQDQRVKVASIIVNQGTTPNVVVGEVLSWVKVQTRSEPFFLTWYTPGLLVPRTLRDFFNINRKLRTATRACLFPGEVDDDMDSVSGPYAEQFALSLHRRFNYAILSAYSFDLRSGQTFFHYKTELALQKACATRSAEHKFLFLDSSKLNGEGEQGYHVVDLLDSAQTVTIYTVSDAPETTSRLKTDFQTLCKSDPIRKFSIDRLRDRQAGPLLRPLLRLQIVGSKDASSASEIFAL